MTEITIQDRGGIPVVSSREIAERFNKRHGDVLEKISKLITEINSTEKSVQWFITSEYIDLSGKSNREYLINRDGFSLLVMGFTGGKALEWKLKYIEAFNKMAEHLKNNAPALPTTYKEALKQLLDQVEKNEQLAIENKELKPKAEYFDVLVERNLLTNLRDTAKELGIKERKFVDWLESKGFIYRDANNKVKPVALYITGDKKYFEMKEFTRDNGYTGTQTLVTPRGREAFRLLLKV